MKTMKRILFVDDETHVLDALERTFRSMRKEWHMEFAPGGEEALAILEAEPFDVIVTDMRMPGMDGARLLELVRERYPSVLRLVLSGYFEMQTALRVAPLAHQCLMKPCSPEKLREAIERCCNCSTILPNEATRLVLNAVGELPSLPSTYAAILEALHDPETSLKEIGKIIEQDVGMTAKILQLVNSSFFAIPQEIDSIPTAVSFLGLDMLKQLVLTVEIFRAFQTERPLAGFSLGAFQRHSHLAAGIAGCLPASKSISQAAVIAALLHDTGKLILAWRAPEQFEAALRLSAAENRELYTAERELTGTDHAQAGAYLLALWGLPNGIVNAIFSHHHPPVPSEQSQLDIAGVVHLANALANELASHGPAEAQLVHAGVDMEYLNALGMAAELPVWRTAALELSQNVN